jgi:hypothetical protein
LFSNDLSTFDIKALRWTGLNGVGVKGRPPSARSNMGLVSQGGRLFIFGGTAATSEEGIRFS